MSDAPRVHTAEPLVPISDEQIIYRAKLDHWTMTDALFWLSGHRSPGYESTRHMQDHFWDAYMLAVHAIEAGKLCRKIERAGKTIFMDSPKNWLAWADRIGPEHIKVDERMRRALSQTADSPDGAVKEEPQPVVSKATTEAAERQLAPLSPASVSKARKSWVQDRTDYWVSRARKILGKSPRLSLIQIAQKIEIEDAPDHLPDDQKEAWKKKGWTTANIHRRLKGRL